MREGALTIQATEGPLYYGIGSRCLELEELERSPLEYCQQLILSCILNICNHLTSSPGGDSITGEMNYTCV